jgi:tetraprenyl-beta-curcumene synthase
MLTMALGALCQVLPEVERYLHGWRARAEEIPSPDLRTQALASIDTKAFHCAGGGMYGLLAGERRPEAIRFIVAYQTISDYLDNLCDRSVSLNPDDFRLLHTSMLDALAPSAAPGTAGAPAAQAAQYYRLREEQDDGGYLAALVATCQEVLSGVADYEVIAPYLHELAGYYCALQVHKHIRPEERIPVMHTWFAEHQEALPPMTWYEFSACSGSTLGIFALVAYALGRGCDAGLARAVKEAHFPWVQGLHILLDYLIDQAEDRDGGNLNFCACYPDEAEMAARLTHFYRQANASVAGLPHAGFHRLINQGLLGIYGSDPKVRRQEEVGRATRGLIRSGGAGAWFFYLGCRVYRRVAPGGVLGKP